MLQWVMLSKHTEAAFVEARNVRLSRILLGTVFNDGIRWGWGHSFMTATGARLGIDRIDPMLG
jgi:hypothetical protein